MNFILFVLFITISPVTLFVTVNSITSINFSLIDVRLLLRNCVAMSKQALVSNHVFPALRS